MSSLMDAAKSPEQSFSCIRTATPVRPSSEEGDGTSTLIAFEKIAAVAAAVVVIERIDDAHLRQTIVTKGRHRRRPRARTNAPDRPLSSPWRMRALRERRWWFELPRFLGYCIP